MPRRIVVDCDACKTAKDIGDSAEILVKLPREPGEMDGGSESVAICHACALKMIVILIRLGEKHGHGHLATVPIGPGFVQWCKNLKMESKPCP